MPTSKRPDEAILPQPARPQLANTGYRSRPCHLARITRYPDGSLPTGLPQRSGLLHASPVPSNATCSYRNAAFQALLSAPMFVEFLRAHNRQIRKREKLCSIHRCLACASYTLVGEYWSMEKRASNLEIAVYKLWNLCWEVFWGKEKPDKSRIGPGQHEPEFYTDAFLLHFLAAMQQQLEFIPSEYSTFQSLFTIHAARRWKCKSSVCKWTGPPSKWESSFYLPLQVQKPCFKKPQTSVMEGLNAGLQMWVQKKFAFRRGSTSIVGSCGKCGGDVESQIDLVNLPELLILVRNVELLDLQQDSPDIPYSEILELKTFTPHRHETGETGETGLSTYQLVSGTMGQRMDRKHGHAVAFARGPADSGHWYGFDDDAIDRVPTLDHIDAQQRPPPKGKPASITPLLLPEVLIYRRIDDNGWNHEYQADQAPVQSAAIPDVFQEDRLGLSRSVHEHFTYQVGQGQLKFKIDLFPGDPEPQDIIDFNIDLGYELNGNHWGVKLQQKLLPHTVCEDDYKISQPTEFKLRPVYRNRRRKEGALSPTAAQEHRQAFMDAYELNEDPANSTNPFTATVQAETEATPKDGMDVDPTFNLNIFKRNPMVEAIVQKREQESMRKALLELSDWQPKELIEVQEIQKQVRSQSKKKKNNRQNGKNNRVSKRSQNSNNGGNRRKSVRISNQSNGGNNQNHNNNRNHSRHTKNSQHRPNNRR